ncbi:uncharacterized protein BDZ99DRAFT_575787 [Mytilinidion resinicola]|uniref:Uncharacterized protein n=1 Tax=Mytilinidion resinicola TaxID=574789 RepID=A0A6A6Y510_9PEZI|nr:uncharacterized protein BDZ99DRAFT_575787 [Mytilinidion resinicola]KAF2803709.1 hypothetical protein BDZ99DRAFT_575787 [Mytilinidion resinicola]
MRSDAVVQQNSQINSTMDKQLQELSIQFRKTALLQKDVLKATRTNQLEHAKTRGTIADGNQKLINTVSSKLDDLRASIPKESIVATKSDREI